ncbi:MAG: ester cyclase [Chloroflexota bacterium]|nr:ester cyclase [Chloroflexota bacterium]
MSQEEETIPQMVEDVRAGKMPRRNFMKALTAMGISAVGVGAIVAATEVTSSRGALPGTGIQASAHPAGQRHIQLHDRHLKNQAAQDAGALQQDYASHAVVEDSMYEEAFVGREAIMARKRVGMAAIPDLQLQVTNRVAHGNQVSVEWVASGTHSGDFPGLPASGRPFSFRGVTVVVRHNEKIVRESLYYDMQEVRRQLG